jgi:L-asparaginase
MTKTARVIADMHLDKTIVLTGAMVPYKMYGSDCLFNIGTALALVQTLPSGVYIGINGECFDPLKTEKNQEQSRFERTA